MDTRINTLFYATGFAIMVGWLLYLGQDILLPIALGVISVYILATASAAIAKAPIMKRLPDFVPRFIVLMIFVVNVVMIVVMITNNIEHIIGQLPIYQENLQVMVNRISTSWEIQTMPSLEKLTSDWLEKLDIQALAIATFGSITSVGSVLFMTFLYAAFLFTEVDSFRKKTITALGSDADQALSVVAEVNQRIGQYLTIKTIINIVLAGVSFVIMLFIGIDSAIFWAVMIGLLNYIPYVGSAIGVAFPVLLALAQFGSVAWAFVAFVLLMAIQIIVGNFLEPKLIGKSVNLSSFVVLVALIFWTSLWGLPGAILAIPLTSVLLIILAASDGTRPIAIFLSADGKV